VVAAMVARRKRLSDDRRDLMLLRVDSIVDNLI